MVHSQHLQYPRKKPPLPKRKHPLPPPKRPDPDRSDPAREEKRKILAALMELEPSRIPDCIKFSHFYPRAPGIKIRVIFVRSSHLGKFSGSLAMKDPTDFTIGDFLDQMD